MTHPAGHVKFDVEGEAFTARLNVNVICDLEEHLDRTIDSIWSEVASGKAKLSLVRAVFWHAIAHNEWHGKAIGAQAAGEIIQIIGAKRCGELIGEAMVAAFPDARKDAGSEAGENPPKAG